MGGRGVACMGYSMGTVVQGLHGPEVDPTPSAGGPSETPGGPNPPFSGTRHVGVKSEISAARNIPPTRVVVKHVFFVWNVPTLYQ